MRDFGEIPRLLEERFQGEFTLRWSCLEIGSKRHASASPWQMEYVVDEDEGGLYIEYYVTNRFVWGDIHERLYATGEKKVGLATIAPVVVIKPGQDPQEKQRLYDEHNRQVAEELRAVGLFPEGDINAHLRTNPELR